MSQPEAWLKDSSPNIPSLSFQPMSRGNIYMKGTDPSHPGLKRGKERAVFTGSPRTVKGCDNRYFQGTKLLVIFGRRPLVGQNTTIVSIYIAASGLHKEWTIKVNCVFEFRRYNLEKRDVLLVRGETTAEGCCLFLVAWICDKRLVSQETAPLAYIRVCFAVLTSNSAEHLPNSFWYILTNPSGRQPMESVCEGSEKTWKVIGQTFCLSQLDAPY